MIKCIPSIPFEWNPTFHYVQSENAEREKKRVSNAIKTGKLCCEWEKVQEITVKINRQR